MPDYLQRESNKITVANFYEGYKLGKYNFDPPYQRRSLWTEEKKSFFIDSILKNFPIPPIFLHQIIDDATGKTKYDVIDGKQRLTALVEFIENVIPVSNEFGENFSDTSTAGLFFHDFDDKGLTEYKSRFWRYVIPIEYVDTGDQDVIDSIFDRLNRNGEPLTGQELRHSTYYGTPLLKLVEHVTKCVFWNNLLVTLDRTRMEEVEFVSELTFLIIEGEELHANQEQLDELYQKYAENNKIDYQKLGQEIKEVTEYMQSLGLNYEELRIRGVSHLYGLFAFSYRCLRMELKVEDVGPALKRFFELWKDKKYDVPFIKDYKDSMSARTKDKAQRKKRTEALVQFCTQEPQ